MERREDMERRMVLLLSIFLVGSFLVLLLNIFLVGSFYPMANGASGEEVALRNAVASAGPATIVLTTDITLTASLPDLTSGKVLTVIGRCGKRGEDKCVLSGGNYYALFQSGSFNGGSLTLENLVITATADAAVSFNGALKVNKVNFVNNSRALDVTSATGTITNSQFVGHSDFAVVTVGGSDHMIDDSSPDSFPYTLLKFVNCIFSGNKRAMTVLNAAVSITSSQFTQNVQNAVPTLNIQNAVSGGAIHMYYGRATISDSRFSKNSAVGDGGAIYIYGSTLEAVNVKFEENVADGNVRGGGAVAIAGEDDVFEEGDAVYRKFSCSTATFEKCSFVNNKARNAFGGAFSLGTYADVVFCESTFSGNTGKRGKASNGYVIGKYDYANTGNVGDNGERLTRSILTNPLVTIPAVQLQQTFFSPPSNVVYGKGTCKSSFSQQPRTGGVSSAQNVFVSLTFANIQGALKAFLRNFRLEKVKTP